MQVLRILHEMIISSIDHLKVWYTLYGRANRLVKYIRISDILHGFFNSTVNCRHVWYISYKVIDDSLGNGEVS